MNDQRKCISGWEPIIGKEEETMRSGKRLSYGFFTRKATEKNLQLIEAYYSKMHLHAY